MQKINNTAVDFIESNIQPEYITAVQKGIENFIKQELAPSKTNNNNTDKLASLEQKLIDDYYKYNYMNHPTELLDRYIELCAKDGEIAQAKTEERKKALNLEKNIKKDYLQTVLALASIIEMQELLMDAADMGNPALATYKFKTSPPDFLMK